MNLIKCYQTNSTWYKGAYKGSKPVGVLWHDTGAGNPTVKRYVQPLESDANYQEMISLLGKNTNGNDWNHITRNAGVNAFIGKLDDGSIGTVQCGDWTTTPWGCGGGTHGSCNGYYVINGNVVWQGKHWIQFEICDDGYNDKQYLEKVYQEACELTAYLCKLYDIDPMGYVSFNSVSVPTILCHHDSYTYGVGGNHEDVLKWFKKYGYSMDKVRTDVSNLVGKSTVDNTTVEPNFDVLDVVRIKDGVTTYYNGKTMQSWVLNSKLYVRQINSGNTVVVSTLKEGAITGTVFATDLVLIEKSNKEEDNQEEQIPEITVEGTPSTGTRDDVKVLWDFFTDKLNNDFGVAGLLGNLYAESSIISNNLQQEYETRLGYTDDTYTAGVDSGMYDNFAYDEAGYGLAQWTYNTRKKSLLEYAKSCNKSIGDFEMQMQFIWKELNSDFTATLNELKTATTVKEASDYVLHNYEGPEDQSEKIEDQRCGYGQHYYDLFHIETEEPEEIIPDVEEVTPEVDDNLDDDIIPEDPTLPDDDTDINDDKTDYNKLAKLVECIIDFIVKLFKK